VQYATEVTLQPLDRYPLDAAILFSDILTIPDAFGLGLHFVEGEGPRFHRKIESEADLAAMPNVDMAEALSYVLLHRGGPTMVDAVACWEKAAQDLKIPGPY
jgi:uroporphyrinogen decarboxylase